MQLIFTPMIWRLMEQRRQASARLVSSVGSRVR